jgi:ParB family transcriptional regulator, chromosome partitioning protein
MPPRKSGLGRGLDALFGQTSTPSTPGDIAPGVATGGVPETRPGVGTDVQYVPLMVEIGRIEPNPLQPRRQFDQERLQELADSIVEHGVIQPLVVTQVDSREGDTAGPPRYQLVAGERRWQAARLAGLVRVPVVVREAAGRELLELALVENVQRADLNPLEEAVAYQQLAEEFGMTQDEIGRRVSKSRYAISNTIRLLHLPASVQQAVLDGLLSEGHARAILGLAGDREAQQLLAQHVIDRELTVRQTEELVRRAQQAQPRRPGTPGGRRRDASADEIEERFREALGTKVQLSRSKRGGRLVIHYYDDEQLMSLYDRLAGAE